MKGEIHPSEGDTLVVTSIVHNRAICGLGLPNGYQMANTDQRFDEFTVEVVDVNPITVGAENRHSRDILTLRGPDGETCKATYRGREPIAGRSNQPFTLENSQGAQQSYKWHK